jgi:hypothetical protein
LLSVYALLIIGTEIDGFDIQFYRKSTKSAENYCGKNEENKIEIKLDLGEMCNGRCTRD